MAPYLTLRGQNDHPDVEVTFENDDGQPTTLAISQTHMDHSEATPWIPRLELEFAIMNNLIPSSRKSLQLLLPPQWTSTD